MLDSPGEFFELASVGGKPREHRSWANFDVKLHRPSLRANFESLLDVAGDTEKLGTLWQIKAVVVKVKNIRVRTDGGHHRVARRVGQHVDLGPANFWGINFKNLSTGGRGKQLRTKTNAKKRQFEFEGTFENLALNGHPRVVCLFKHAGNRTERNDAVEILNRLGRGWGVFNIPRNNVDAGFHQRHGQFVQVVVEVVLNNEDARHTVHAPSLSQVDRCRLVGV